MGKLTLEVIVMKIKDVMTQSVVTVTPADSVEEAARCMREHDIGSVPVCDNDRVLGMITDRDIVLRVISEGKNAKDTRVREVMTSNPVTGSPEMNIEDAARIMGERQIRRLPIEENNSIVGVVSLGDFAVEPSIHGEANHTLREISEPCCPSMH